MARQKLRLASAGLACLIVSMLALQGCVATAVAGATLGVAGATVNTAAKVGGVAVGTAVKVGGGAVKLTANAAGLGKHRDRTPAPSN